MFGGEEEERRLGTSLAVCRYILSTGRYILSTGRYIISTGAGIGLYYGRTVSEYNNQPYFNFVKCLEEKRKDVDWEHRWELQLVDPSPLLAFSFYIY